MSLPTTIEKEKMVALLLREFEHNLSALDIKKIVEGMVNFSHHDVSQLQKDLFQCRWKFLCKAKYFYKASTLKLFHYSLRP